MLLEFLGNNARNESNVMKKVQKIGYFALFELNSIYQKVKAQQWLCTSTTRTSFVSYAAAGALVICSFMQMRHRLWGHQHARPLLQV